MSPHGTTAKSNERGGRRRNLDALTVRIQTMKYRPEIDGLRALAVLAVIMFHAEFKWFSGGFIGVDVFFVISGYLITTILINDLENQRFSVTGFYERRARRILPALFFVTLICIPFAWFWMLPSQMMNFSQSLVAVSLFLSNIFFWTQSGYFAPSADAMLMLHTWSLAVEEQYYVVFPVFLLLAWRLGRRWVVGLIVIIALISLLLSEIGWRRDAVANFYLPHARIWELLAGSIAAFVVRQYGVQRNNLAALSGLLAIITCAFVYDDQTPIPSVYALAPVLGTVGVIVFADAQTWVARLLGTRVLVGLGLISYSAYLWHQPVFAFARIRIDESPSVWLYLGLIVLSLGLAVLSWRFVETPFRRPRKLIRHRLTLFSMCAAATALFTVFGVLGSQTQGFVTLSQKQRDLAELERRVEINYGMSPDCEWAFNLSPNCETSNAPELLLWGDSYAMHLYQGIAASKPGMAFKQHTISSCSPILGLAGWNPIEGRGFDWVKNCIGFNNAVYEWLQASESVEFVILSSPFDWVESEKIINADGEVLDINPEFLDQQFSATIQKIRALGVGVVLVSPTPRSGSDIGKCLSRKFHHSRNGSCGFDYPNDQHSDDFVRGLEQHVPVYWLQDDICVGRACVAEMNGVMIYRDSGHLSKEGSAHLGARNQWYDRMKNLAVQD